MLINEDFGIMTNSMDLANYVISSARTENHNFWIWICGKTIKENSKMDYLMDMAY